MRDPLIWLHLWLKPTIYHCREEHVIYYTNDMVTPMTQTNDVPEPRRTHYPIDMVTLMTQTHDLPLSRRTRYPLHHWYGYTQTHDLSQSRRTRYPLHHWYGYTHDSNPRCTTIEKNTLSITPMIWLHSWFKTTIYSSRKQNTLPITPLTLLPQWLKPTI